MSLFFLIISLKSQDITCHLVKYVSFRCNLSSQETWFDLASEWLTASGILPIYLKIWCVLAVCGTDERPLLNHKYPPPSLKLSKIIGASEARGVDAVCPYYWSCFFSCNKMSSFASFVTCGLEKFIYGTQGLTLGWCWQSCHSVLSKHEKQAMKTPSCLITFRRRVTDCTFPPHHSLNKE